MQLPKSSADSPRTREQTTSHLIRSAVGELSEGAGHFVVISMNNLLQLLGVKIPSLSRVSQSTTVLDRRRSNNVNDVVMFVDRRRVPESL